MTQLMRRSVMVMALVLLSAGVVRAQAPVPEQTTHNIGRARLVTVLTASATSVGAFSLGLLALYGADAACDNPSEDSGLPDCTGSVALVGLLGASLTLVAPGLVVNAIGKTYRLPSGLGMAIGGSVLGGAVGGACTAIWASQDETVGLTTGLLVAGASVAILSTTGAMLGYNFSAKRKARRLLQPLVAPTEDRTGLVLGLAGRL